MQICCNERVRNNEKENVLIFGAMVEMKRRVGYYQATGGLICDHVKELDNLGINYFNSLCTDFCISMFMRYIYMLASQPLIKALCVNHKLLYMFVRAITLHSRTFVLLL